MNYFEMNVIIIFKKRLRNAKLDHEKVDASNYLEYCKAKHEGIPKGSLR